MYPTLESTVGNTPLVRLQRMPGDTTNVILGKLEGNNPAGSVKDRPALSMIVEAEKRGDIKPGDTLIEATSGNTGIALAMVAAMKGYRMILVMPDNLSLERRQTMRAFGAELVLTPKAGGMERARDLAEQMRDEGKGIILDQFANPDNPLAHYRGTGPEIWRDTAGRITHFVSAMGTTGTIMGVSRFLKEKNPAITIIGAQPEEGSQIPGIRKWPEAYLPKIFDRARVDRDRDRLAGRRRGHDAPARARGRHLRRHLGGRRVRGRAAHRARGRERDDRVRRLRSRRPLPVDRRVPGAGRGRTMTPILVFDIETVPDVAGLRRAHGTCPRARPTPRSLDWYRAEAARADRQRFPPLHLQKVVAIACALRDDGRLQDRVGRRAGRSRARADPPLLRRHRQAHAAARVVERRRLRPAGAAIIAR